jgi:hypothetical protein
MFTWWSIHSIYAPGDAGFTLIMNFKSFCVNVNFAYVCRNTFHHISDVFIMIIWTHVHSCLFFFILSFFFFFFFFFFFKWRHEPMCWCVFLSNAFICCLFLFILYSGEEDYIKMNWCLACFFFYYYLLLFYACQCRFDVLSVMLFFLLYYSLYFIFSLSTTWIHMW